MIRTIPFVNTATYKWALSPYGVRVARVRGYNSSATAKLWLQLHTGVQGDPSDANITLPANATVPLEEFEIATVAPFDYDFSQDVITSTQFAPPLILALSTAAGTLTAATTENSTDVWVDIEEFESPPDASWTVTVNNAPENVNQVWAELYGAAGSGNAQHQLFELTVANTSGAVAYLKLFAKDSGSINIGDIPFRQFTIPANNAYPFQRLRFGEPRKPGLIPQMQDSAGLMHYGCTLLMESSSGAFASNFITTWKYQVKYK